MKFVPIVMGTVAVLGAAASYADVSIHISEDASTVNGQDLADVKGIFNSNKRPTQRTYIQKGASDSLNSETENDANKLKNSIEFAVLEIGENYMSHAVYASGAGICRGYRSKDGVEFTDSSTYYVNKSGKDYYATIIGATMSSATAPRNVQYVPIFNIADPKLEKAVRQEESKKGRAVVNENLKEREDLIANVVCEIKIKRKR